MLAPEQAQKQLEAAGIKDVTQWQLKAIKTLPDDDLKVSFRKRVTQLFKGDKRSSFSLRGIAYTLMGHDFDGKPLSKNQHSYWRGTPEYAERHRQCLIMLDTLPPPQRLSVFEVFFPRIAPQVELLWNFVPRLPYQGGYARKAFRAPHNPDIYLSLKDNFLSQFIAVISSYHQDVTWFAQYAPYIGHGYAANQLGALFAAVIDAGGQTGDAIFDILVASARGEHEIGAMGRHVTRALLTASRPDGWEFVEKLLLAAQREEGLRQVILEAVDEAHPMAFRRMLRLILDHDLARFSAVTRAMNVWFGFLWDSESVGVINQTLRQALTYLEDYDVRETAFQSDDGEELYLALWSLAFEDAFKAIPFAAQIMTSDTAVERRFAAAYLLTNLQLTEANRVLVGALRDVDLRVVAKALPNILHTGRTDVFEEVEIVLQRLPKNAHSLKPIIWPWQVMMIDPAQVTGNLIELLGDRSPKKLIPYVSLMDSWGLSQAAKKLAASGLSDPEVRAVLFKLVGDRNSHVRHEILKLIEGERIQSQEAEALENLLTRKTGDLRRGVISLLVKQTDAEVLASADRLIGSPKAEQRIAGLELLRILRQNHRAVSKCQAYARGYQQAHVELTESEKTLIETVLEESQETYTLDNALGLMNPAERSQPTPPRKRPVKLGSKAATASLLSLDALIHQHRSAAFKTKTWQGENQEILLGNAHHHFPQTNASAPIEEDLTRLPFKDIWEQWVETRPGHMLDDDGLELVRALIQLNQSESEDILRWLTELNADDKTQLKLNYRPVLYQLLLWLIRLYPAPGTADFLLDRLETIWSGLTEQDLHGEKDQWGNLRDWRTQSSAANCLGLVRRSRDIVASDWQDQHHVRLWGLLRWMDEPIAGVPRFRPALVEVLKAHHLGAATEADLYDQLVGARRQAHYGHGDFDDLYRLSAKHPQAVLNEYPALKGIFDRCRQRILEVELKRGEMPTAATAPAARLRSIYGTDWFVRILRAFASKDTFERGYSRSTTSRLESFSHLLRICFPTETDTPEDFARQIKAARISQKLLVEAAVYAPQWAVFIEHTLGLKGLVSAVWWIYAHTKDRNWSVDAEVRDTWSAEVSQHTPLSASDLLQGGVDVEWFWKAYHALGAKHWEHLYDAAKYSSGGAGHNRARLFADAMLGKLDLIALVKRITDKRYQDAVRALGLLPLPETGRDDIILERYRTMQNFLHSARKVGAQRRESEKLAVQIGMENLARTAGYPDPLRLQWAMEAREVADLRAGSVSATHNHVTMTLSIDFLGKPQVEITKAGKRLKSLPAKMKNVPEFAQVRERKTLIEKQHSRMRLSLENAMCRGDDFTAKELAGLLEHPVLAPLLQQLIFVGYDVMGYPVEGGSALQQHDGSTRPIQTTSQLRLAHPYDLYQSGEWHHWQRECFLAERIQPFKQVFRELYLLTGAEKQEETISRRYAGHQVQPRQAVALLSQRGWVAQYDSGIQKTFHREKLSVHLASLGGYFTPAEVEGITLEGVIFTQAGQWKPLPLLTIPPMIFSEVMRDLDLVVSVAHRGGVDPETTASTIEMRSSLMRETCALLKIRNVTLQGNYALIEGKLGSYSVHLGSAVVHRQPGGALCIVPVHAQQRGRIFLPFADDDPKTAEVISKTLLLAKDAEIKDPSILEQLFARG